MGTNIDEFLNSSIYFPKIYPIQQKVMSHFKKCIALKNFKFI